jgi:hypothetical protein
MQQDSRRAYPCRFAPPASFCSRANPAKVRLSIQSRCDSSVGLFADFERSGPIAPRAGQFVCMVEIRGSRRGRLCGSRHKSETPRAIPECDQVTNSLSMVRRSWPTGAAWRRPGAKLLDTGYAGRLRLGYANTPDCAERGGGPGPGVATALHTADRPPSRSTDLTRAGWVEVLRLRRSTARGCEYFDPCGNDQCGERAAPAW